MRGNEQAPKSLAAPTAHELFGDTRGDIRVAVSVIDAVARFHYDDEATLVASAVDARRREFATGRRLAHGLLAELRCAPAALLVDSSRAPRWPSGAVGTLSHGAGVVVVAVAPGTSVRALGVDVEDEAPLASDLLESVLRPSERALVVARGTDAGRLAKVVFSAKESVHKALSTDVGRMLEFQEVEIELLEGRFRAHLHGDVPTALRATFEGRWLWRDGRVWTGLARR